MSATHGPDRFRALYRRLVALYPRSFRELYERDLLQAFDDRRTEARFAGTVGGARLILFLLRDFVTSVPLAHHGASPGRGVERMMRDLWRDLRYTGRMLAKNPMFTLAAVTTLALGIGLNAATFSAVNGILLRPLDGVEAPEELVQLYRHWGGIEYGSNSIPHYQDVRDRTDDVFENVAAWFFEAMSLSTESGAERTYGMLVSANFFQTYGVRPVLGRAFLPGVEDRGAGSHPVAVLGYGYWQSAFGADPEVIGRTILVNGRSYEVVGVAPAGFGGPLAVASPPVYIPLMMQPVVSPNGDVTEARGSNSMSVVARLREGRTIEHARQAMDGVLAQLREEYPDSYDDQIGTTIVAQNEAGIHPSFGSMQMEMGAVIMAVVALLLLIACVNVANLFLARARDRRREMGVRLSLGAGRGRLVRQLLTESLVFSLLGGLAGLALARVATGFFGGLRPPIDGPWDMSVDIDGSVLGFTVAVSVLAGVVFGLVPALHAAGPDTAAAIKGDGGPRSRSRASNVLVVAQMALSLLLLMSSGLFLRSLQGATRIDPGFDEPRNIVTLAADPGLQGYEQGQIDAFWDRMLADVAALPGVTSSGLAWTLPLSLTSSDRGVAVPGYEFAPDERSNIHYSYVSEGYFGAMGIDLLEGRDFTPADDEDGAPILIVNQRFAERFWPGESAVGKTVRAGGERTVVGVVETGKYGSLGEAPTDFMYFPFRDSGYTAMTVVARVATDPATILSRLREVVRDADPNMPVYDARSMEDHMGLALLPARLGGAVLGVFGLLGLGLAAVGIYGVMAYSVSQRTRELGVRVALGADRTNVVRLVLSEGLKLAIFGTAIGVAGALGASRLVRGLLYNVSAIDPVTFGVVPAVLLAVAALAVYLPARRAARVDPMRALKSD